MMDAHGIGRVWHGWTTPENSDLYERLLKDEIFPGIFAKNIAGLERIELFRRDIGAEVEFVTIMRFRSLDDVKAFVGENYERAYVPASAQEILSRFDDRSRHYEIRASRTARE